MVTAAATATTVLLVSDDALVAAGLRAALSADGGMRIVDVAASLDRAVQRSRTLQPDVVVVADRVADVDGAQVCAAIKRAGLRSRVLIVSEIAEPDRLVASIESGVDGYVEGGAGLEGLAAGIRKVAAGSAVVPPQMLGPLLRRLIERRREDTEARQRLDTLTPRQTEILRCLGAGMDQHVIAGRLVISPETARTHIQNVMAKLGARTRVEAANIAIDLGLVADAAAPDDVHEAAV